jgi:hypothetical protein
MNVSNNPQSQSRSPVCFSGSWQGTDKPDRIFGNDNWPPIIGAAQNVADVLLLMVQAAEDPEGQARAPT